MSKHVIDQADAETSPSSVARFTEIARQNGPAGANPKAKEAHQRPHAAADARMKEFLRIEKGDRQG